MDVYEVITDRVIKALEAGTPPWRQTWDAQADGPRNLVSKRPYHGVNTLLLLTSGYSSPWWLTFKQAQQLGGSVRKGEHATLITFWKRIEVEDKTSGDHKIVPLLRYYRVFNVEQCDGIKVPEPEARPDFAPLERAEKIFKGYAPHGPSIRYGGDRPAYTPDYDMMFLPERDTFDAPDAFYTAAFHEMTHSTGHKDRLNRPGVVEFDHFGSERYSREELIAEIGAAFLAAEAGITTTFDNSAAYIAGWLKALRNDPRAVVVAAGAAQRAADHILGRGGDEVTES